MIVHIIHYFVEDGEAGISAVFHDRQKAEEHFAALVRGTWEGYDADSEEEIEQSVKEALETNFHDYPGSGSGARPWYKLTEEEVR